jgi:hypothetical protein
MVYFGGRERSVVTIVDVPPLFCWSALQKAVVLLFFEKTNPTPFSIPRWRYGGKLRLHQMIWFKSQPRLIMRKPIFEPVLSFQPTSLKDQYLDEHAGVAVIALYQVVANKTMDLAPSPHVEG